MIGRIWKRFWARRDLATEAANLKAIYESAQRRHVRSDYIWAALNDVTHERLRAGL